LQLSIEGQATSRHTTSDPTKTIRNEPTNEQDQTLEGTAKESMRVLLFVCCFYFVKGYCRLVLIKPSRHFPSCRRRLYFLENFLRKAVDGKVRSESCVLQDAGSCKK
jgi:hypothetical protein